MLPALFRLFSSHPVMAPVAAICPGDLWGSRRVMSTARIMSQPQHFVLRAVEALISLAHLRRGYIHKGNELQTGLRKGFIR